MTETAKKKKSPAGKSPRRTAVAAGRKQLAQASPPTTSSTPPNNPPLPLRTRAEPQLDQPPRYSLLFPPQHIGLPQPSHQSLRTPPHTSPPSLNVPLSLPTTGNAFHPVSSDITLRRPDLNSERPTNEGFVQFQPPSPEAIAQEALCDLISTKFDAVITSIDGEQFDGNEQELVIEDSQQSGIRGGWGIGTRQVSRGANRAISTAIVGTNYFAKVNLYANSKLPPNLPALQLYGSQVL